MGDRDRSQGDEQGVELPELEEANSQAVAEAKRGNPASWLALKMIGGYQKFSRYTPPSCRFTPTCSEYTRQAIIKYGFLKGSAMGAWRICRCHPFCEGGEDPVP